MKTNLLRVKIGVGLILLSFVVKGQLEPFKDDKGKFGYKDRKTKEVKIPVQFAHAEKFHEGLALVKYPEIIDNNGNIVPSSWGFIDTLGNVIIKQPQGDLFIFQCDDKGVTLYGYKTIDGEDSVNYSYFHNGRAWVAWMNEEGNGGWLDHFIDKTGKIIAIPTYTTNPGGTNYPYQTLSRVFSDSLLPFKTAIRQDNGGEIQMFDKFGFFDINGIITIPAQYDVAHNFSEDLAWVAKKGKETTFWGCIDRAGKTVIPFSANFIDYGEFHNGLAFVKIEKLETIAQTYCYDCTLGANGEILSGTPVTGQITEKEGKFGYINKQGILVIPAVYDEVADFINGKAKVRKDEEVFYIDKRGNKLH